MRARPSGFLFEAANPRHAHEWEDLRSAKIPDDKIMMPGCLDSTTNFVEHPRLIAQRICNVADIVGRERVVAGADCGFATFAAQQNPVAPSSSGPSSLRSSKAPSSLARDYGNERRKKRILSRDWIGERAGRGAAVFAVGRRPDAAPRNESRG